MWRVLLVLLVSISAVEWYEVNDPHFLTTDTFIDLVYKDLSHIKVIKFFTPWCKYCRYLKTIVDTIKQDRTSWKGIKFYQVNCDNDYAICSQAGVKSFPTVIMFDWRGKYLDSLNGFYPEQVIRQFLSVADNQVKDKREQIKAAKAQKLEKAQPSHTEDKQVHSTSVDLSISAQDIEKSTLAAEEHKEIPNQSTESQSQATASPTVQQKPQAVKKDEPGIPLHPPIAPGSTQQLKAMLEPVEELPTHIPIKPSGRMHHQSLPDSVPNKEKIELAAASKDPTTTTDSVANAPIGHASQASSDTTGTSQLLVFVGILILSVLALFYIMKVMKHDETTGESMQINSNIKQTLMPSNQKAENESAALATMVPNDEDL